RGDHPGRREEDMDSAASDRPQRVRTRASGFLAAVVVGGLLAAGISSAGAPPPGPSLSKEEAARAEAEAKRAFDSGRFQEAGEKYARAAEGATTPERRSELAFQSGWAYFIAGNSKAARESLKLG